MDLGLTGKAALVWGGSKGMGYAAARQLALEGVDVVIAARTESSLQAAAQALSTECGRPVRYVVADITRKAGREAALAACPQPDILVNNSDGYPPGDFRDWSDETWVKALDANMLTPIALIQTLIDGMAVRGFGRIVNITSSSVKAPIDILGLSNGARSGLTGFVAGVARSAIAGKGVTINNILPGKFDTDRIAATISATASKTGKSEADIREAQQKQIPAGRYGTADEFGAICAFLCSQQAAYITGQNILPDGGSYVGTF